MPLAGAAEEEVTGGPGFDAVVVLVAAGGAGRLALDVDAGLDSLLPPHAPTRTAAAMLAITARITLAPLPDRYLAATPGLQGIMPTSSSLISCPKPGVIDP